LAANYAEAFKKDSFTESILFLARSTSAYDRLSEISAWFSRLRILRLIIRVFSFFVAFLEAGIFFIIASSILLFVMPVLVLLYFGVYSAALIFRRYENKKLENKLSGRRVFVFFADRERESKENSFFSGLCKDFAKAENAAVIVVSPFFFSSTAFGEKKPYLNIRSPEDNLYICRRTSFFSLRRTVLSKLDTVYFF